MALPGLVAANNLSDVVDKERAWDNLGQDVAIDFDAYSGIVGAETAPTFVPITVSGYDAIDREGAVSLWVNAISLQYAVSTNNGATFIIITQGGSPVTEGLFSPIVFPLAAETIGGINQILWTLGDGTIIVWNLDVNWAYVSANSIVSIGPATLDLEVLFRYDINGDGFLGQGKTLIETSGYGNTFIYIDDVSRRYFVSDDRGATFTMVIRDGQPITEGLYAADVVPLAAENIGGINQMLWTLGAFAPGFVTAWRLTSSWVYSGETSVSTTRPAVIDVELAFKCDVNGDGVLFPITGGDILALNGVRNTSTRDFTLIKGLSAPAQPRIAAVAEQIALAGALQNAAMLKASPTTSGNYLFSSGVTLSGVSARINNTPALSIATSPFSGSTATASILLRELQPQANWRITEPMPSGTITSPEFAIPFETNDFVLFMKTGQS